MTSVAEIVNTIATVFIQLYIYQIELKKPGHIRFEFSPQSPNSASRHQTRKYSSKRRARQSCRFRPRNRHKQDKTNLYLWNAEFSSARSISKTTAFRNVRHLGCWMCSFLYAR